MKVTNTTRDLINVTDSKGETYHVNPMATNVDLPTISDVSELPKGLVKVSD